MRRPASPTAGGNGRAAVVEAAAPPRVLRCAVYCRKSVEERHATDFGSIDAQREAGESYVAARADRGWTLLPHRFDDEGHTGANIDRPALQHLLADIEDRRVDVVVVYKVDRLSRSLLDFARLMETFERCGVAFISITQEIDTTTSMGRLMLNVLFSFAQFEREMISERTRDKMRAARRRGKFTGGMLILGYDRHPEGRRLVVNEAEAERVRGIFDLYLREGSLVAAAQELNRRGWTTKSWVTRKGREVPPRAFGSSNLRALLTNPAYAGKVRIGGQEYDAECPGIVGPGVFEEVQALRARHARTGNREARTKHDALLAGLLRCTACDTPMVAGYTKRGTRLYRYYVCSKTREEGWAACPTKSVPAREIERVVVDQIRGIGEDPDLQARTLEAARAQAGGGDVDPDDLRRALTLFDPVWEALFPREQARVLHLLLERVGFDRAGERVELAFRPTGIRALAREAATAPEETP